MYTNYYPRSEMDVLAWAPPEEESSLRKWWLGHGSSAFRWVPPGVRVLDIGCGFGQSLGYHLARGCDVCGVEADENIRRVAEQYGLNVKVGLFDADDYEANSFDYVTLDQVIEHVAKPLELLQSVSSILKPGGVVIVSTPNARGWGSRLFGRRWIHWHVPYHQQFFSTNSMKLLAKKTGFDCFSVKTMTNSEWLHYQWLHLVTYPEAGKPSAFWSPRVLAGKSDRMFIKCFKLIHRLKVNHLVTRVFDIVGLGDNRVYFLRKS
ncbi:class I SAM-dependent methyltransferase [Gammaproteobacteria bacterium]|nr:class I SAM-dependent methyltransferase [Gammaproteobacteria bacterium]